MGIGLLDLPEEIEEHVYGFLFAHSPPISLHDGVEEPPISTVCRRTRAASLKVFYMDQRFAISSTFIINPSATGLRLSPSLPVNGKVVTQIRRIRLHWTERQAHSSTTAVSFYCLSGPAEDSIPTDINPVSIHDVVVVDVCLKTTAPWYDFVLASRSSRVSTEAQEGMLAHLKRILNNSLGGAIHSSHRRKHFTKAYAVQLFRVCNLWLQQVTCEHRPPRPLPTMTASTATTNPGMDNNALQDYNMQLILLEQQNRQRFLLESDGIRAVADEEEAALPVLDR
jgi:hypothetical protein